MLSDPAKRERYDQGDDDDSGMGDAGFGGMNDVNLAEVEGDLEALEEDIIAAQADAEKLSYEDARLIVQEIVDEYQLDPNFPRAYRRCLSK